MMPQNTIERIFDELSKRYDRISVSTIKGLLKGKVTVSRTKAEFSPDRAETPNIEEAEAAFLKYTCAIFTAFRGGYTLEQNIGRNERLKADMDALGLKYRPVTGCYREADWEYASIEYCYFVSNVSGLSDKEFFEKVYQLSAKYDQDSLLYKRAGINRTAFLVATTEAGKADLKGDIKFAGQLYLRVPDVDAWTDLKDGRIAFQLKGMILIGTGNKKIHFGEGNLFDTDSYEADGLVVLRRADQQDLEQRCKNYDGIVPLFQHRFVNEEQTEATIRRTVMSTLNKAKEQKCRKIGFHCSAIINGSSVSGAAIAYEAVKDWCKYNNRKFDWIVLVDTYGDYSKMLDQTK